MGEAIATTISLASVIAFVALAVVAVANPRRSQGSGRWLAVAFSMIAVILLSVEVPLLVDAELPEALGWARLVLLPGFPTYSCGSPRPWCHFRPGWRSLRQQGLWPPRSLPWRRRQGLTMGPRALVLAVGLSYWMLVSLVTAARLW